MDKIQGSYIQRAQVGSRRQESGGQATFEREKYEDMEPHWPNNL